MYATMITPELMRQFSESGATLGPPQNDHPERRRVREKLLVRRGLMHIVYRMEDRIHVLKTTADPTNGTALKLLKIEVQIYERVGSHSNIIGYHGMSSDERGIILDWASYLGIHDFLEEFHLPPVNLRFKWITQTATALSFLHSKGIIHYDLTYSNVLLTEDLNAKLADFGGCSVDNALPSAWSPPPFYPDRTCGDPPHIEDDIFGFGSLVFTLMAGAVPHDGVSYEELSELYTGAPKMPPVPKSVDPRIARIIVGCWSFSYDSMDVIIAELQTISDDLAFKPLLGHSETDDQTQPREKSRDDKTYWKFEATRTWEGKPTHVTLGTIPREDVPLILPLPVQGDTQYF